MMLPTHEIDTLTMTVVDAVDRIADPTARAASLLPQQIVEGGTGTALGVEPFEDLSLPKLVQEIPVRCTGYRSYQVNDRVRLVSDPLGLPVVPVP